MVKLVLTDLRSGLQGGGQTMEIGPHSVIWIDNDVIRAGPDILARRSLTDSDRILWWPEGLKESDSRRIPYPDAVIEQWKPAIDE